MGVDWHDDAVIKQVSTKVEAAMMKAVLWVEADAKKLCPVDTGRLRASITHRVISAKTSWRKGSKDIIQGRVGTNVHYAPYQELGTDKMPAQPYLRPALEKNWGKIKTMFESL